MFALPIISKIELGKRVGESKSTTNLYPVPIDFEGTNNAIVMKTQYL